MASEMVLTSGSSQISALSPNGYWSSPTKASTKSAGVMTFHRVFSARQNCRKEKASNRCNYINCNDNNNTTTTTTNNNNKRISIFPEVHVELPCGAKPSLSSSSKLFYDWCLAVRVDFLLPGGGWKNEVPSNERNCDFCEKLTATCWFNAGFPFVFLYCSPTSMGKKAPTAYIILSYCYWSL